MKNHVLQALRKISNQKTSKFQLELNFDQISRKKKWKIFSRYSHDILTIGIDFHGFIST